MKIVVLQRASGYTGGVSSAHNVEIDGDASVLDLKAALEQQLRIPQQMQTLFTGSSSGHGHRIVEDGWTVRHAVHSDTTERGPGHHDLQLYVAEEPPAGMSHDTREAAFIDSGKGINSRERESQHHTHHRQGR